MSPQYSTPPLAARRPVDSALEYVDAARRNRPAAIGQVQDRVQDAGLRSDILKPFRIVDLLEMVRSCVSRKSPLPQAIWIVEGRRRLRRNSCRRV